MILCGSRASSSNPSKKLLAKRSALILTLVFAAVFAWRASLIVGVDEKAYLFTLLCIMAAGSLVTFLALVLLMTQAEAGKDAPHKKQ